MFPQRPQVNPDDRYTVAQAHLLLGCGTTSIYRYIADEDFLVKDVHWGERARRKRVEKYITGLGINKIWGIDDEIGVPVLNPSVKYRKVATLKK